MELVSLTEASRMLGKSVPTVRRWADAGRLRAIRTPLGRLLEREDVERVAAERAARKTA